MISILWFAEDRKEHRNDDDDDDDDDVDRSVSIRRSYSALPRQNKVCR